MSWTDDPLKASGLHNVPSTPTEASAIVARFVHICNEAEWVLYPWWLAHEAHIEEWTPSRVDG